MFGTCSELLVICDVYFALWRSENAPSTGGQADQSYFPLFECQKGRFKDSGSRDINNLNNDIVISVLQCLAVVYLDQVRCDRQILSVDSNKSLQVK